MLVITEAIGGKTMADSGTLFAIQYPFWYAEEFLRKSSPIWARVLVKVVYQPCSKPRFEGESNH